MNILERETNVNAQQQKVHEEEEEGPQCLDTTIMMWDDDEFEEFQVEYLNQVYPQKITKETVSKGVQIIFHFLSSSLHYWVQFKDPEELEEGKLSKKDIKYIGSVFSEQGCDNFINYNRWGQYFNKQNEFLKREQQQKTYKIPEGQKIHEYSRGQDKFVVIKYLGSDPQFVQYKKRFQILFLFYIDGVSFVNEETNQWEYYLLFKKKQEKHLFVGALSKFIFRLTSVKQRDRISQVLILPQYQKSGHGMQLLNYVYEESIKNQKCFELTTQIPSFEYQCLRDFKQSKLILEGDIFELNFDLNKMKNVTCKNDIEENQNMLLTKQNVKKIKESIKIPGHQIERLANLFIYAAILNQEENEHSRAVYEEQLRQKIIYNRSAFKSRTKIPHITINGTTKDMKDFFLQKAKEDYVRNSQEIEGTLSETLDGYRRVIMKLLKNNILKKSQ